MEHITIKSWAEEDRPREKLMLKGKHVLSDAELIAILISSGNAEETAVELSKRILAGAENNLNELSRQSVHDLIKYKGIGEAKAISIVAALELGRRRKTEDKLNRGQITTSKDAVDIFQPLLGDKAHEEFWILFLNRANHIIGKNQVSSGGMTGTVVDPKMIFKAALDAKAVSIILCHNHPSGNVRPSQQDIDLTKKIFAAGKLLEISVLDHVIVAQGSYYSFADEGMM
ncbi:MAG: DNA repair protein RadC [Bacteroidetes bacterium]|nr:DNA repair protein RadC [Bacteroidota bacterium]